MVGKNIAALRKMRGLNQIDLAKQIHATQSAVSQWETGRTMPDLQQLHILSDYFGVTVDALTSDNGIDARKAFVKNTPKWQVDQSKKRGEIAAEDLEGEIAHIAPSAMDVLSQFLRLMNSLPEDKQAQVAEYALMCAKIHEMEATEEKQGVGKE